MKNEEFILQLAETVEEALKEPIPQRYDPELDQPHHFTWIQFYWGYGGLASDYTHSLEYADASELQEQLIKVIRKVFNPANLELIREAKLTEFGLHLGPYRPSGGNVNDELGLEVPLEMQDRGD